MLSDVNHTREQVIMTDSETTVAQLRQAVEQFVDQRDWHKFHTPKNLAMSLSIEAAELMEHFQWITAEQSRAVADQPEQLQAVGEELSDCLCYLLAMANELNLDLCSAFRDKMVKNGQKYPAPEYRGRFGPDDPNPPAK